MGNEFFIFINIAIIALQPQIQFTIYFLNCEIIIEKQIQRKSIALAIYAFLKHE